MAEKQNDPWNVDVTEPAGLSAEGMERWRQLRTRLADFARQRGLTKHAVTQRSGISAGTLYPWYDGSYEGSISNISEKVERWLDSTEEQAATVAHLPVAPGYFVTPTSAQLTDALLYAQSMPEIVLVTLGAGMGKTETAREYVSRRAHAHHVTMRPTTGSVYGMLTELTLALDVNERNPARLDRALGDKLKRNGRNTLLIVDEAQNLTDPAVNQLRYFLDVYGCGIALLGNEELYGRFGGQSAKPAYAQLHRRFGLRLRQLQARPEDIAAQLDAWQLTDPGMRQYMLAVGRKPGALGQVDKTLRLASMYARGEDRTITLSDLKSAAANRGLEG